MLAIKHQLGTKRSKAKPRDVRHELVEHGEPMRMDDEGETEVGRTTQDVRGPHTRCALNGHTMRRVILDPGLTYSSFDRKCTEFYNLRVNGGKVTEIELGSGQKEIV